MTAEEIRAEAKRFQDMVIKGRAELRHLESMIETLQCSCPHENTTSREIHRYGLLMPGPHTQLFWMCQDCGKWDIRDVEE